jgi:hypothetical protein
MNHSVYKINLETNEHTVLYKDIDNIDDALLLAQLAMSNKTNIDELIFITPGWNKGIETSDPKAYKRALELAENNIITVKNNHKNTPKIINGMEAWITSASWGMGVRYYPIKTGYPGMIETVNDGDIELVKKL